MADSDIAKGGGIVSVIGAVTWGAWWLISRLKNSKRVDDKTAIGYYRGLLDKLDQRSEIQTKQMQDAQASLAVFQARLNACAVDNEALWGVIERQHAYGKDIHEFCMAMVTTLEGAGHSVLFKPKPPPDLPERKSYAAEIQRADYARRTAAHTATSLEALNTKIQGMKDGKDPTEDDTVKES